MTWRRGIYEPITKMGPLAFSTHHQGRCRVDPIIPITLLLIVSIKGNHCGT